MWEQLSYCHRSSPPLCAVSQHGIQSDQQYSHT
ncbi:hypothetical protein SAMN05660455_00557, partial [Pseudomonas sp. LAMO17WK12:I5]